jgi:hypothetical protein
MAKAAVSPIPPIERRTQEFGFTATPRSGDVVRLAARISGKKLATYLRDVIEADAAMVVAQWQQRRGAA